MLTVHARTEDERLLASSTARVSRLGPMALVAHPGRVCRRLRRPCGSWQGITIFGSARIHEDDPYTPRQELAGLLAKEGSPHHRRGPGIMEAANRAPRSGGLSIGCNIELPHEQSVNRTWTSASSSVLFARKTMFVKYADGFAIFPGGFGTFDEFFESLTLIQTGKIRHFPVVLIGKSYWSGLLTGSGPSRLPTQHLARGSRSHPVHGRHGPAAGG